MKMTTGLLLLGNGVALSLLFVTAYLTRATLRRFLAATIAGLTVSFLMAGVDALARDLGWWRYPGSTTPYAPVLMYLAAGLWYGAGVALIVWRVTRRFGRRGLAAFLGIAGILGPARDYAGAAVTGVIVFAPGIVPLLADALCWIAGMAAIQGLMRLIAGPARGDRLARTSPAASVARA